MINVIGAFNLQAGGAVLMCPSEEKNKILMAERVITEIGIFDRGQYEIAECTRCFTNTPAIAIRLKTQADCSNIKAINIE